MSVDAILEQVKALTPEERAELIERLQAEEAETAPLTDSQKAELDRRIAFMDANPGSGIPWEVVLAESLKRTRK